MPNTNATKAKINVNLISSGCFEEDFVDTGVALEEEEGAFNCRFIFEFSSVNVRFFS